jgi:hypothetical protein
MALHSPRIGAELVVALHDRFLAEIATYVITTAYRVDETIDPIDNVNIDPGKLVLQTYYFLRKMKTEMSTLRWIMDDMFP